jgi:uncharacterized protein (TIGR03382 family)
VRQRVIPLAVLLSLSSSAAWADLGPRRHDDRQARSRSWRAESGWILSTPEASGGGGTRVAALYDATGAVGLEARGVDGARTGRWLPMQETFREGGTRVAVVDLGRRWPAAQLRLTSAEEVLVGDLGWEILTPRYPDAGRKARSAPLVPLALDTTLATIGVVSRADWGSRSTQCSTTEDDWYRMAIHHTAGPQTRNGTVAEVLRALQAYEQDSGEYCDLPYQFMVGHDGSLYEGRPLNLYSGATGGNNDGNIAVCFVGCYHPTPDCPTSHPTKDEMIAGAHLLVQTLVRLHDIPANEDRIKGHRDWPGNSTLCPGAGVYARLAELRADMTWFTAAETGRSFPAEGPLAIGIGEPTEVWIELENRGGLAWQPGDVFLATTGPRDGASPLADDSWPAPGRAATVTEPVAPGATGRFAFTITAAEAGEVQQTFGLVHGDGSWFADAPWGAGPADDAIVLHVVASAGGGGGGGGGADGGGTGDEVDRDLDGGCSAAPGASSWGALLLLLLLSRRRRASRPG